MARRYYQLPNLTSLNVFDACARHGSLTAAAGELGVTLGAVSRQVKALETELNCVLFTRRPRGVELTAQGRDLFQVLANGFQQIGKVCQELRSRGQRRDVTVAATTAFASLWLMPRLGDFWRRHRDINLNHAISDNPDDPGFAAADIRLRYGDGRWRGECAVELFGDRIYPVCGIEFAQRHALTEAAQLLELPLLRLDSLDPAWIGWGAWFAQWGCDFSQARFRRFNNYVVALQAAEENQGVALGWHSQVEGLIERGKLVRLGDLEIDAPGGYYLTWDENRELSPAAVNLRDWLLQAGAAATPNPSAAVSPGR
ncbi:MAG: LysR substrate-binding domain-containing protein [Gammaproteobacteria bacterium]|nr:LysR substrate-binding domain-containing protein [Gammaproteobacteria bacterium]